MARKFTVAEKRALSLVLNCVRNTELEDLHAGIFPDSKTGDYSDVKVVTPYGEIPWNEVSRISDEEMKSLMISVVNHVFTYLSDRPLCLTPAPEHWNRPQIVKEMLLDTLLDSLDAETRSALLARLGT